ncbi:MlaD family protein [Nocardioides sp.]|uniref:MlaD family protein n=1 Tax=Nocardioides sp. TaxID=35761 RepID=UPI00286C84AC|nr:MlaD family protein [Nocardioides sp.]
MRLLRSVLGSSLYLSLVGVIAVFAVGVAYLFAAVLDQPLTARPVAVTVELPATGGLFEGSAVTYRGVKIGKVSSIDMTSEGVEVSLRLRSGTEVPRDSLAQVRSLSPVGEQYLDFQPTSSAGPYLASGDVVTAVATDLPQSLGSTVVAVNKVLRQIDDRALRRLLVELSTGLKGTGDDLGRLVDQGAVLLADLDRIWPETERLLVNSDRILDIAPDQEGDLRSLATSAWELAAFLRDYDPELRRTLRRAPAQLESLDRLVRDAQRVLPSFLSVGVSLTDILASHDPHLRALLQAYPGGLGALAESIKDGELDLQLIADQNPRCDYGTSRRSPRNSDRRPLVEDARCSASFSTLQRGAAHAPGPVR